MPFMAPFASLPLLGLGGQLLPSVCLRNDLSSFEPEHGAARGRGCAAPQLEAFRQKNQCLCFS